MNFLKKPFSISLQALAGVLVFSCLLAHPFSEATSSPPGDKRDYMLVLNTYTESAPWSRNIINNIVTHIDQVDNFEVYIENMNSLLMTIKNHKIGIPVSTRIIASATDKETPTERLTPIERAEMAPSVSSST